MFSNRNIYMLDSTNQEGFCKLILFTVSKIRYH